MEEEGGAVASAKPRTHGLAIAALVCGITGFLIPFVGFVLAILGIVFGVKARAEIDASSGELGGRGMAVAGFVLGIVALGIAFLWLAMLGFIGGCASVMEAPVY